MIGKDDNSPYVEDKRFFERPGVVETIAGSNDEFVHAVRPDGTPVVLIVGEAAPDWYRPEPLEPID